MSPLPPVRLRMRAFSLIEIIAVAAIVGLLTALLLPMAQRNLKAAKAAQSLSNLRNIGNVLNIYANDNNGVFPLAFDSETLTSWIAEIWPYTYSQRFPGTEPRKLKGSIFYTPLVENETTARTYGLNTPLELKYPTRNYRIVVPEASKVALSGDVKTSGHFRLDQINYRNNGLANVLFLDGHTEGVKPSSVPTSTVSLFWTGVSSN